jgi:HK97 gp10 family phage protein
VVASSVRITGLPDLQRQMQGLGDRARGKIARGATAAGATVILHAAKAKASQQPTLADKPFRVQGREVAPGYIADNLIVKRVGAAEHKVTMLGTSPEGVAHSPYAVGVINEFGTAVMAAQPFMRPALDEATGEALRVMTERVRKEITR